MQLYSYFKIRETSGQSCFYTTSDHLTIANSTEASISSKSTPTTSKSAKNEKEQSAEEVYKPIVSFPNRQKITNPMHR